MVLPTDDNTPTGVVAVPSEGGSVAHLSREGTSAPESQQTQKPRRTRRQGGKRNVVCRYIRQGQECPKGSECLFLHTTDNPNKEKPSGGGSSNNNNNKSDNKGKNQRDNKRTGGSGNKGRDRRGGRGSANTFRKTQIEALLKAPRLTVKRLSSDRKESAFAVEMRPSDPDFPFDVSRVYMAYIVPASYPTTRTSDPTIEIQIANKNIPAGVKHNIEVGFAKHVRNTVNTAIESGNPEDIPTLEEYIGWIDQNLELLMQQKPATTMKFTSFSAQDSKSINNDNDDDTTSIVSKQSSTAAATKIPENRPAIKRPAPKLSASHSGLVNSQPTDDPRRAHELSQIERRFRGSYTVISDDKNGDTVISIEITPSDPEISVDIGSMTAEITVSRHYPNASPDSPYPAASLRLSESKIRGRKGAKSSWNPSDGIGIYLQYIESMFAEHVETAPETSLLHHLNWLDRQLADFVSTPPPMFATDDNGRPIMYDDGDSAETEPKAKGKLFADDSIEDKPWIKTISISEANLPAGISGLDLGSDASGNSSNADSDNESGGDSSAAESGEEGAGADNSSGSSMPLRRGIEIRFGKVVLSGISIAHCHSLNLTVRCARCKGMVDVKGIVPSLRTGKDNQMWKACDVCSTILGVRFRPDWMFQGVVTLGYLDCSGCAPIDIMPSKYTLECEKCAMDDDEPGNSGDEPGSKPSASAKSIATVSVGTTNMNNCRKCHSRLTISLNEPQFVRLMSGVDMGGSSANAKIRKEVSKVLKSQVNKREELAILGIIPGKPLPNSGTCKHFRKSNRWLRFPCCGKIHPCVTCHDEKEDHPYVYAQNMICGFCAKEQRITKAEQTGCCVSCGNQVVRKVDRNHAFWQGGTGTRDRTLMSRRDTRKYQGIGKTVSNRKKSGPKK